LFGVVLAAVTIGCRGSAGSGNQPVPIPFGPSSPLSEGIHDSGLGDSGMVYGPTIPDDFPRALRLYPGGRVTLGGVQALTSGKRGWSLTVETADSKERVLAFYRSHLAGFEAASDIDLGDSDLSVWRSPGMDLDLLIGRGADGKTTVTLDVEER
jgi:hypothetical protein